MKILDFFNPKCQHNSVPINEDIAYCPDCGELIENQWYIMRCSCCGIKIKAIVKNGEPIAQEHFCHNCGSKHFEAERVSKINFIDINYAVLVKAVITKEVQEFTQSWQNMTNLPHSERKLLTQT